jgi:hypothetical protein
MRGEEEGEEEGMWGGERATSYDLMLQCRTAAILDLQTHGIEAVHSIARVVHEVVF